MPFPTPQPSDGALTSELAAIADRLSALAAGTEPAAAIGAELGAIRAQLRQMAEDNAEVGVRLSRLLGLQAED